MTETTTAVTCGRCGRVLVDADETGPYYQAPVEDPDVPGLVFADRVYECDGKPHEQAGEFPDPDDFLRRYHAWGATCDDEGQRARSAQWLADHPHLKPCPACQVPMTTENGLWYCDGCDAYHGEADEDEQEEGRDG